MRKKEMDKLPCINCITLAVCKSIYRNGHSPEKDSIPTTSIIPGAVTEANLFLKKAEARDILVKKCRLLDIYLYRRRPHLGEDIDVIYKAYLDRRQTFFDYMDSDDT